MPLSSGAEQDRLGGWLGGNKGDRLADVVQDNTPKSSGAEQDRFGGWFGGSKGDRISEKVQDNVPRGSGAEQDRYGGWFGGNSADMVMDSVKDHLPRGSGAEQDRYGGWFGGDKGSKINQRLPGDVGAEQERYGSHFGNGSDSNIRFGTTTTTLGLIQGAVLPSFGFHTGLGAIAYGIARYTDRAEGKDWLWPSGQVANAWWSALGTRVVYDGLSVSAAWGALTYDEKLLLTGVSAWGIRLFYRIVTRSTRRGKDDARYEMAKRNPGFWNRAFFTMFLPEAFVQTLISLPFTLPFRAPFISASATPVPEVSSMSRSVAVFLFTAGFAFETLADSQLEAHTRSKSTTLNRSGVWSIVRHPNYLGDAMCHLSFPVLLYSAGLLHPLAALGPIVNYVFLRYIGGDKENENSQANRYVKENQGKFQQLQLYKQDKNRFWPSVKEVGNKWLWAVAAAAAGGVVIEQAVVSFL